MLPIPHLLLFLPFCIFAGVAVAVAVTQLTAWIVPAPVQQPGAQPAAPPQTAQIFYFTLRQTSLGSNANRGGSRRAMLR